MGCVSLRDLEKTQPHQSSFHSSYKVGRNGIIGSKGFISSKTKVTFSGAQTDGRDYYWN